MKADTYALASIFGRDVRYVVPLYQRPYVWNEEEHWEPLWQDILWVLDHLDTTADEKPTPHFLGAIVVEQQATQVGEIDMRSVIDGQQRLTTLQLLLAAASRVAERRGHPAEARLLAGLTSNNEDLAQNAEQRFKVWPTNTNRDAFLAVMAPHLVASHEDDPENQVHEAHDYFFSALDLWAEEFNDDPAESKRRFAALTAVVRDLLKVVVIDLDREDNAQAIFETLNARGTPLLAFDLVKNYVFDRAGRKGAALDALYTSEWAEFDSPYWRAEIRQGRLFRPRAELFLMHWLTMKRAEPVHTHQLYVAFKRTLDGRDPDAVVDAIRELSRDGTYFKSFETQPLGSVPRRFFDRLDALDTTTVYPIALWLFREQTPEVERDAIFLMLESWLVRRTLSRLTAQAYNRLTVDLLQALQKAPDRAADVVHGLVTTFDADSSRWPADAEFHLTLTNEPLFQRLTQKRIVMLLSELENDMRTELAEAVSLPPKLTIEHVLPRSWREHWGVSGGEAEAQRDLRVHRLGNLTLVTSKLNPAMSNSAWSKKRAALNEHSVLLMNRRVVDDNEWWDEARIDARSSELAERAVRIWPGPETSLDEWCARAAARVSRVAVHG